MVETAGRSTDPKWLLGCEYKQGSIAVEIKCKAKRFGKNGPAGIDCFYIVIGR